MKIMIGWLAVIALTAPVYGQNSSQGAEVINKVCSQCHGNNGAGSQAADNFYKLQIPRLNSDHVQKMSDAELKDVIMKGRRKMKPPLTGTPYMQHKVKPELLDDVVAYIRTLKKST